MNFFRHIKTAVAGLSLGLALAAQAQDKPLRILVGFAPGGSTDTVARLIADKLHGPLGRTVIVENKPGAGGRFAAEALKNSPPDGSTYMIAKCWKNGECRCVTMSSSRVRPEPEIT